MFAGVHTALVTPFAKGGIDAEAFRALIDHQFANGIHGIVPVGTTGESPTLSHEEHIRVMELAVEHTQRRGLVIAGTGSNSTDEAVMLTHSAVKAGADACLVVAPYYNKPSQEGLYRHFRTISEATELPIMLYSIPGRCGVAIEVDTVARLATDCPNIIAIKEAGGNVERVSQLAQALPESFEILSGDDSLTVPFMSVGAVGVVSVASNLVPADVVALVQVMAEGRLGNARTAHHKLYHLLSGLLKLDTNPVPIKAALAIAGRCSAEVRLPMVELDAAKQSELQSLLSTLGIV